MHNALQWILDTAPSWAFGLVLVAIIRWLSAKGLGFFLIEILDVEGRLRRGVGTPKRPRGVEDRYEDDVWREAQREDGTLSDGGLGSAAVVLPVFALGWWVTVDLWILLRSAANPSPSLGDHAFVSALIVWVCVVVLGWIEHRERLIEWRRDFGLRTIVTLSSILALSQLVLLLVAPFGLHLYWLVLRVLGAADEKWLSSRAEGPDIRGS